MSALQQELSKEEINSKPLYQFEGEVLLIDSTDYIEPAIKHIWQQKVIGVDTETKPTFKKGVSYNPALLQIATDTKVYLFLLRKILLPDAIIEILSSPDIIKVGVAVQDDMRMLQKITEFTPRAVVDLADVAKKNQIKTRSLRGLTANFLGARISKTARCSNWNNEVLSEKQIRYAATDGHVRLEIYRKMQELLPHNTQE